MKRKRGRPRMTKKAVMPVVEPGTPPISAPPKKRGRPKRVQLPILDKMQKTFRSVLNDAAEQQGLAIADSAFDGGGTPATAPVISKESLERRVARRLNVLDRYLTDDRLLALLNQSSLKEIGVYEGIMLDKSLVLKGQPTVIVGSEDRQNLNEVLPRLLNELKRRNMVTTVSERKIEFQETKS